MLTQLISECKKVDVIKHSIKKGQSIFSLYITATYSYEGYTLTLKSKFQTNIRFKATEAILKLKKKID